MGGSRARSKQASWDSSSEDELDEVSDKLYAAGSIQEALLRLQDYAQAVQELTALLQGGVYSTCFCKAAQALLVKNCSVAISYCSGRMRDRRALAALMEAVERQLPQSKRNALLREYKKGSMALRRREKKGSGGGGGYDSGSDSDGSGPTTLAQLPPEVVSAALAYLDPVSLASAACVCCEWRALASEDGLWGPLLERTFPARQRARLVRQSRQSSAGRVCDGAPGGQQAAPGVCKLAFTLGAQRHPRLALMWKSNRVLGRNGRLSWLSAAEREAMLPPAAAHASYGALAPCSNRTASLQQQPAPVARSASVASQQLGSQAGMGARSIQPSRYRHLSPSDVAEYYRRGGRLPAGSGTSSSSSSSGSESEGESLSSRLRFWRVD